jgi:hypothetical protein
MYGSVIEEWRKPTSDKSRWTYAFALCCHSWRERPRERSRRLDQEFRCTQNEQLHLAAANGLEKAVRMLLRARAETTTVDSNKHTPLLLAVLNHHWRVVPILTIPPNINSWDEEGMTALHYISTSVPKAPATWKDIATAAVPFCERGVSRSMRDRTGATPLILAVKTLPEEGLLVVEALLMQQADKGPPRTRRFKLRYHAAQALVRGGIAEAWCHIHVQGLDTQEGSAGPISESGQAHLRTSRTA